MFDNGSFLRRRKRYKRPPVGGSNCLGPSHLSFLEPYPVPPLQYHPVYSPYLPILPLCYSSTLIKPVPLNANGTPAPSGDTAHYLNSRRRVGFSIESLIGNQAESTRSSGKRNVSAFSPMTATDPEWS